MSTKNKIALITGGSRGLGKDMAINLAKKGLDVILTYNSNKQEADNVVNEILSLGQKAGAYQLNVSDAKSFDEFVSNVLTYLREKEGSPNFDFLINNAGFIHYANLDQATEEEFDDMLNVHFKGPFFLTQKLLPFINENGGIVNVSSGLTRFATPGFGTYAAMKGAMEKLTLYLAKELGSRKIRVNIIAPGAIETDIMGGAVRDNSEMKQYIASQTALGRVGLPDDIGGVVAFVSYLSKEFNLTKATVSDTIKILEQKKLIIKKVQTRDLRSYTIALTVLGLEMVYLTENFADPLYDAVKLVPAGDKLILWNTISSIIQQLHYFEIINVQNSCHSCSYFLEHDSVPYCSLMEITLKDYGIKLDCSDHKPRYL